MENFEKAFKVLMSLEFSNPNNYLHKNKTEQDYTVAGIYKYANQNWIGWFIVANTIVESKNDIKKASSLLYKDKYLKELVLAFYKEKYWDRMRLDEVHNYNTALEMFIFGVNAGTRNAIRKAQKVVGADEDGFIGKRTLGKLNLYDIDKFSMKFDELELEFYKNIIKRNASFAIYKKGWEKRARYV